MNCWALKLLVHCAGAFTLHKHKYCITDAVLSAPGVFAVPLATLLVQLLTPFLPPHCQAVFWSLQFSLLSDIIYSLIFLLYAQTLLLFFYPAVPCTRKTLSFSGPPSLAQSNPDLTSILVFLRGAYWEACL